MKIFVLSVFFVSVLSAQVVKPGGGGGGKGPSGESSMSLDESVELYISESISKNFEKCGVGSAKVVNYADLRNHLILKDDKSPNLICDKTLAECLVDQKRVDVLKSVLASKTRLESYLKKKYDLKNDKEAEIYISFLKSLTVHDARPEVPAVWIEELKLEKD